MTEGKQSFIFREQTWTVIPGTYSTEICDICGKKRKCDLLSSIKLGEFTPYYTVTMDACRECEETKMVKV